MRDPFGLSKAAKPMVDAARRMQVKNLEARKGRLVRVGPKKTLPKDVSGREFVEWVRRERLGVK